MSVSVVVQRFRECKLLLLETEYITVGGGDDSCGLLGEPSALNVWLRGAIRSLA